MKNKILFVDDEPLVLQGLQRMLRPQHAEWDMAFCECGTQALAQLGQSPFDVVVSDMIMPGMNGAEFLARVCEVSADTVRVMLTGSSDLQTAMDAVNQGHVFQFLLKPVEHQRLVQSLTAAVRQHQLQTAESELLQHELEHSKKMSIIGQLAAGITHDLNNILTAIMGETELALLDDAPAPAPNAALRRIQEAATRATELTRELVGFSRRDHDAELQRVDLQEAVKSCIRIVQPMLKHHVNIGVDIPPELPAVLGHAGELKQVFVNLLINARDAMPLGGEVRVNIRQCHFTEADTAAHPKHRTGPHLCLTVGDTGCGMDAATQLRAFEPFFTTKEAGKGAGLGLFMVANILERHRGWVELESALGRGATFSVFLPSAIPSSNRSATS